MHTFTRTTLFLATALFISSQSLWACDGFGKSGQFGYNPAAAQAYYAQKFAIQQQKLAYRQFVAQKQYAQRQARQQELLARREAQAALVAKSENSGNQFGGVSGSAIIDHEERPKSLNARIMVFSP